MNLGKRLYLHVSQVQSRRGIQCATYGQGISKDHRLYDLKNNINVVININNDLYVSVYHYFYTTLLSTEQSQKILHMKTTAFNFYNKLCSHTDQLGELGCFTSFGGFMCLMLSWNQQCYISSAKSVFVCLIKMTLPA